MVGVLPADFDFRKLRGIGPSSIWPLVVVRLKASSTKLILLKGSGEPRVFIGEAADVGNVAGKFLDELVARGARNGMRVKVCGASIGLIPCEFGIVGGVFEEGLPQRFRLVERGEDGGVEVGIDFDNEAEVGRPRRL